VNERAKRLVDVVKLWMREVDLDLRPALESERCGPLVRSDREERVDAEDVPPPALPARDAVELAELLERVYANVRVGADAHPDASVQHTLDR
jgi:hypothetical protein